jgi:hypothetical protein
MLQSMSTTSRLRGAARSRGGVEQDLSIALFARILARALVLLLVGAESAAWAQSTSTASYRVLFEAQWSAATHPIDIPPDPHFSPLIGGTHDDQVVFWAPGALASAGIKNVAELGDPGVLGSEVDLAITSGTADQKLLGGGIPVSPGAVFLDFTAQADHSRITLVSMLAPSPDWFVGVRDFDLVQGGEWIDVVVVDLGVYDAGTDSGTTFQAPDQPTLPPVPITLFDSGPFSGSMQHVGTFTIQRLDTPPPVNAAPVSPLAIAIVAGSMALGLLQRKRYHALQVR